MPGTASGTAAKQATAMKAPGPHGAHADGRRQVPGQVMNSTIGPEITEPKEKREQGLRKMK